MRLGGLRFFFFSREESPPHIHVEGPRGEAKIWLEPRVEIAEDHGLGRGVLTRAIKIVRDHQDEFREAWKAHFGR